MVDKLPIPPRPDVKPVRRFSADAPRVRAAAAVGRIDAVRPTITRGLDPNRMTSPAKADEFKRPGGAPPGPPRDMSVAMRMSLALVEKIDAKATALKRTRSDAMRIALEAWADEKP